MHVNQDLQSQLTFLQRQFDSVMTTAQSQTTQPQAGTLPGTNATVRTVDPTTRATIPVGGHRSLAPSLPPGESRHPVRVKLDSSKDMKMDPIEKWDGKATTLRRFRIDCSNYFIM